MKISLTSKTFIWNFFQCGEYLMKYKEKWSSDSAQYDARSPITLSPLDVYQK
jgi:hypothetical protein